MNLLIDLALTAPQPVLGGALHDVWVVSLRITFFMTALLLVLIVLLQEGKGGGLAAALGGQGAETFGVATGGVNKVTMSLATLFLFSALLHAVAERKSVVDETPRKPERSGTLGGDGDGGGDKPGEGGGSDTTPGGGEKPPETPPVTPPEKPAETPPESPPEKPSEEPAKSGDE